MRGIKKLLFLFVIVAIFSCYNVQALGGTYEYGGFKYTIKKIHLDVYKSKLNESNQYVGYEKDMLYSIDLPDTYTVNPTYLDKPVTDTYLDKNTTHICLNLNATKEEILNLLKTKISTVDANNHYFIRMMVDFTVSEVPAGLTSYTVQILDNSNGFVDKEHRTGNMLILGETYSEAFQDVEYKLVDNAEVLTYATTYDDSIPDYFDFYFNYTKYTSDIEFLGKPVPENGGRVIVGNNEYYVNKTIRELSFNNYSNINDYINSAIGSLVEIAGGDWSPNSTSLGASENNGKNTGGKETQVPSSAPAQVVQVPNTAGHLNIGIYLIGVALVIIGSVVITVIMRKKKASNKEEVI